MRYRILSVLLLFLLTASIGLAGDWRVIPIKMFLGPKAKSGSVRLINNDQAPLNLQVSAKTWSQDINGQDIYEETDDIIFFPRVMTVPPGKEQVLRAGIKIPATTTEKTYRLFIEEIPESTRTGSASVTVAIRFGLPIFVAPLEEKSTTEVTIAEISNGTFTAAVKNTGNVHFLPGSAVVTGKDKTGQEIFSKDLKPWYILAGMSRPYSYSIPPSACQKLATLRFEITDSTQQLSRDIPVSGDQCHQ